MSRFLMILLLSVSAPSYLVADEYKVTIKEETQRRADVEAWLSPKDGLISLNDDNVQGLTHGWSTFIHNLRAFDRNGVEIPLTYIPTSKWKVKNVDQLPIRVTYTMLLQHDRFPLNFGDNGAAYANSQGLMWSGRCLFLKGEYASDVVVEFDTPEDWKIATEWHISATNPRVFNVESTQELVNCAIVAGTFEEERISSSDVEIQLVLMGKSAEESRSLLSAITRKYIEDYEITIGPAPDKRMLIIAAETDYWGGEVMGNSISLSLGGELNDPMSILMIRSMIAHEIIHLWGAAMNFDEENLADVYWFHEGLMGTYMSYLALLRQGDLDPATFLYQLSEHGSKYLSAKENNVSLVSAGMNKSANYDLVYSGGLLAALVFDIEIRRQTLGKSSIESYLKFLYEKYPSSSQSTSRLTVKKLISVAQSLFGTDLAASLETNVTSFDSLPLEEIFKYAGLTIDQSGSISIVDQPTAAQQSIWNSITGQ